MHTELKKPLQKKNLISYQNLDEPLNLYDKNKALIHSISEFQKDTSIISDVFYGFNETTNVCLFCKNNYNTKGMTEPICYNYDIFNILTFPLEEVRKYREQFYQAENHKMVSLYDCFCYNQKSDYFTGDNKNYCMICKQLSDSVFTSKIFVAPKILIIIFNRGKENMFKIKIDFSMQMDISDFVLQKDKRKFIICMELFLILEKVDQMPILLQLAEVLLMIIGIVIMMILLLLLKISKRILMTLECLIFYSMKNKHKNI